MKEYNFNSLNNIDVQTLEQPISRSADEGYQLDVLVCNAQESRLYTYSDTEALYRFGEEDHSDVLEALDAIFCTVWHRYGGEDEFAPNRCEGDGYEVMVTVDEKSECPPSGDFNRFQQFSISLNDNDELVEDMDRLFKNLG